MAKDQIHDAVCETLEKDGWTITHDPLVLKQERSKLEIDLGAEKMLTAERGKEKIALEIKSFTRKSLINAYHEAVGQYMNYLTALRIMEEDRALFLAIDLEVYVQLQKNPFITASLEEHQVKLLVFDLTDKTIIQWIR